MKRFNLFLIVFTLVLQSWSIAQGAENPFPKFYERLLSVRNKAGEVLSGVKGGVSLVKYPRIRSYLVDGRIKAYLNNQQLLEFENVLKIANDDVLKVIDEFKSADEFVEIVRGYKDNPTAFTNAIKTLETFNGPHGWFQFWKLTPRMKNSLNTIAQLKSGNKIADVGNSTDIQLSSIHAYTANGDFINQPFRYQPSGQPTRFFIKHCTKIRTS